VQVITQKHGFVIPAEAGIQTPSATVLLWHRIGTKPATNGASAVSEALYEMEAAWLIEAVGGD
jgi:hypothetical protein